ncbi:MAG: hypothetical protein IPJ48_11545 [Propionivibrio sp.]|uniref:Uncharacterized protein n=1 Tax=Candidatus Propionivibrio dominans TaxID=2954373 RepID=A0A9D7FDI0_9RHOO|nr:hypothetical protein [Candidatus Propionivibrio dominans]
MLILGANFTGLTFFSGNNSNNTITLTGSLSEVRRTRTTSSLAARRITTGQGRQQ